MDRFRLLWNPVWVVLACVVVTTPSRAQSPAAPAADRLTKLRDQAIDLGRTVLQHEALAEELAEEERLLATTQPGAGAADARPLVARKELWDEVLNRAIFGDEAGARPPEFIARLEESLKQIRDDEAVALAAWTSSIKRRQEFRERRAEVDSQFGRPRGEIGMAGELTRGLVGAGLLVVLGGLLLTLHETRSRIRWQLRALASRPSLAGLAAALALSIGGDFGGVAYEAENPEAVEDLVTGDSGKLQQSIERLGQRLAQVERGNREATQRIEPVLMELRRARAAHSLKGDEPWQRERIARAEAVEADVQKRFRQLRVSARTAARASAAARQIDKNVDEETGQLNTHVQESLTSARRRGLIRLGASGLFLFAGVVPLVGVRRRRRRQLDEESRKCPRCLKKDTLQVSGDPPEPGDDRRPKARLVVCDACDYEIRENYIREHRLCFPTVGIRASGKTHWLAMLYRQIKNTNVQVESKIKKIPSREDARFSEMVDDIVYTRRGTGATVYGLPYPLTFHVNDHDRLGSSRTMVNLFDYAGDLTHFQIDGETQQNEFRRRALLCEGFTLFVDPTQVTRDSRSSIEAQVDALAEFIADMHAMRGIPMEQPVDLPIAVCISKIDLLVSDNPIGTRAVGLVAELRETMGQTPTLELIQRRSQLIAEVLPEIFPNWNIERELRENFGGRYMLFPISSVGLDEHELGIKDLADRAVSPFGVIEPLLWLLHMHGYCVLK